jgi:hypothetical protein
VITVQDNRDPVCIERHRAHLTNALQRLWNVYCFDNLIGQSEGVDLGVLHLLATGLLRSGPQRCPKIVNGHASLSTIVVLGSIPKVLAKPDEVPTLRVRPSLLAVVRHPRSSLCTGSEGELVALTPVIVERSIPQIVADDMLTRRRNDVSESAGSGMRAGRDKGSH